MKKLLLIPTIATTVVAPIITITSCSHGDGWIKWDFAENAEYDYKMDIPDKTVSPYVAFNRYLDMIEQNPDDFVHEYMLSRSQMIKLMKNPVYPGETADLNIAAWTEQFKVTAFDKSKRRISFDVKTNQDWVYTVTDISNAGEIRTTEKIILDLSCKNIPLRSLSSIDDEAYIIGTGISLLNYYYDADEEIRKYIADDKKWSISGSMDVFIETKLIKNGITNDIRPRHYADSNFHYNYHTALSDEIWDAEDQIVKCCCIYGYSYVDHPSYYMSNIPVTE